MNFKEKSSSSTQKKPSDLLFILYTRGVTLLSYSLVYILRKPFTVATFDGMELLGMDYKIAASIIQISGYMVSKFIGIKLISELKREGRLKFILVPILVAELSLAPFGCLPRPLNVLALFFSELSFGCIWGVIFSFLEGHRMMGLLASLFGLGIVVNSDVAESIRLFAVDTLHVSEFWMPALTGAVALPLLIGLDYILDHLPKLTAENKVLRVERVTLNKQQHWNLFRNSAPILTLLFFANLLLTVLQNVKKDFLMKVIDVNAAGLFPWVFAKVDGIVTLIILAIFATLVAMKNHIKVLSVLSALIIAGVITLSTVAFNYHTLQLFPLARLFIQSLCLYFSYLSSQTIFFDHFIVCPHIKGDIGFFIVMVGSIGYTGIVVVLVVKECFSPDLNWLGFYNTIAETVGIVYTFVFTLAMTYSTQKYRKGRQGEVCGSKSYLVLSLVPY